MQIGILLSVLTIPKIATLVAARVPIKYRAQSTAKLVRSTISNLWTVAWLTYHYYRSNNISTTRRVRQRSQNRCVSALYTDTVVKYSICLPQRMIKISRKISTYPQFSKNTTRGPTSSLEIMKFTRVNIPTKRQMLLQQFCRWPRISLPRNCCS